MTDNPMRAIRLDKVVVNTGVGEAGEKLQKAEKVLQMVTGRKALTTVSRSTIRDWGLRRNMSIGAKVTLRGPAADAFLRRALEIRERRLPSYSFDARGNFSFGIGDYTDFAGMKYDPEIGVVGMDVAVALARPGYRVARRRNRRRAIARSHRITRDESIAFIRTAYNVEVVE